MANVEFNYPWQYSFPPFFTIQPNLETRKLQLETWNQLITEYCRFNKISVLEIQAMLNEPVFSNKKIDRQLSLDSLKMILDYMHNKGTIEWKNDKKTSCYIYWKTIEEWAKIIYNWAKESCQFNTWLTYYEVINDDSNSNQPFYNMDNILFTKVLKHLKRENKVEIIDDPNEPGLKFL